MSDNPLHPFDAQTFMSRFSGVEDLIPSIIENFLIDLPKLLNKLRVSLEKKDMKEIHESAHAIKGALLSLAADSSAKTAETLEHLSGLDSAGTAQTLLAQLQDDCTRLDQVLREFVQNKSYLL